MTREATINDLKIIQEIVYKTISDIYPNYYPHEVVEFFLNHHSEENIAYDLEQGNVFLFYQNENEYVGTGTIVENSMNRVFVLPQYQGKGYGTQIMDFLEKMILEKYSCISLDSSLPAYNIYIQRGYNPVEYHEELVDNNRMLCYHKMIKEIDTISSTELNLNNRLFISVSNTENGEISNKTLFKYHQKEQSVWASYSGGNVERGTLIGKFTGHNQIYFTYQHLNIDGEIRIGECKSTLEVLTDGRLRMKESWQWLNGDMSKGYSVIEESSRSNIKQQFMNYDNFLYPSDNLEEILKRNSNT